MKEYARGNAVICITRPVLTDEERSKRVQQIITTLQEYGKAEVRKVSR